MLHFADRLSQAVAAKQAPICVGLDPVYERLPASLQQQPDTPQARVQAIIQFCIGVLQAVAPHVPAVKPQSACFERYGWQGVQACEQIIVEAQKLGLIVILDGKRGDIGISSEHYAAGLLTDRPHAPAADALTVNSYLGADGLEPFIKTASAGGKGLFALVRTSNPGGDALQGLKLVDGRSVAEATAMLMAQAGAAYRGTSGYSLLGAVVGATKAEDAVRLREIMSEQIFLVPGFGAQGGKADDVRACFKKDGTGAIITASRSVLFAYEKPATSDWQGAVAAAAVQMKQQIAAILQE